MVTLWTKLVVLNFLGGFIVQTWSVNGEENCKAVGFCGKGKHCIDDCCENCKDCKDGEYMDEDQNNSIKCKQCRKMPAGRFWILTRNCSSIQNAEYDCEDGYKKTKPPIAYENQEECIPVEIKTTSTTPSTLPYTFITNDNVNTTRFGLTSSAHLQDHDNDGNGLSGLEIALIVIGIILGGIFVLIGILRYKRILKIPCKKNEPPRTYSPVQGGDCNGKNDGDIEIDGGGARQDGREDIEIDGGGARQDGRGDCNGKRDKCILVVVDEKDGGDDTPKASDGIEVGETDLIGPCQKLEVVKQVKLSDVKRIEPKQTDNFEFNVSEDLINDLFDCLFQSSEELSICSIFRELKVFPSRTYKQARKDLLDTWIKWFVNCVNPAKNVKLVKDYVSKNNHFPVDKDEFEKCVTSLFDDIKVRKLSRNYRDLFKFMLENLCESDIRHLFTICQMEIAKFVEDNDPEPYIQLVKDWEIRHPNEDILDVLVSNGKEYYPQFFYRREFRAKLRSVQRLPKESIRFVPGEIRHANYAYRLFTYIFIKIKFHNCENFLFNLKIKEHLKNNLNMEAILRKKKTEHRENFPVIYAMSARDWFYCHPGMNHLAAIEDNLIDHGESQLLQKKEFIDLCSVAVGKKKEGSDTGQGLDTLSASNDGEAQHETKSTDNGEEIQNEAESVAGIDPVGEDRQNTDVKSLACKDNDNDGRWEDIVEEGGRKEGSDNGQGLDILSASNDGEAQHETKSTDNGEEIQNEAESGTDIDPVGEDRQNTDMVSEMKPLLA